MNIHDPFTDLKLREYLPHRLPPYNISTVNRARLSSPVCFFFFFPPSPPSAAAHQQPVTSPTSPHLDTQMAELTRRRGSLKAQPGCIQRDLNENRISPNVCDIDFSSLSAAEKTHFKGTRVRSPRTLCTRRVWVQRFLHLFVLLETFTRRKLPAASSISEGLFFTLV